MCSISLQSFIIYFLLQISNSDHRFWSIAILRLLHLPIVPQLPEIGIKLIVLRRACSLRLYKIWLVLQSLLPAKLRLQELRLHVLAVIGHVLNLFILFPFTQRFGALTPIVWRPGARRHLCIEVVCKSLYALGCQDVTNDLIYLQQPWILIHDFILRNHQKHLKAFVLAYDI